MSRLLAIPILSALWLLSSIPLSALSPAASTRVDRAPRSGAFIVPLAGGESPALPLPLPLPYDTSDVDTNNYPVDPIIADYVIPVATLLISVPLHELGHFVTAKALGSKEVSMEFFPPNSGFPPTIAHTIVDAEGLSKTDLALIAIAGVGSTRLMAELVDLGARTFDPRMSFPTFGQRMTSALFIFGRLDFPLYLVTDVVTNLGQQPGGDMDILVTQIAGRSTWPRVGTYLGLLGVAALDLYLDLDRIGYHYTILNGKQAPHPSTYSNLRIGVDPFGGGFGARYSLRF